MSNSFAISTSYDISTVVSQLQTQIFELQRQIRELQSRPLEVRKPLNQFETEQVIEAAFSAQTEHNAAMTGQQISIWDGIEAHVVRATERAHGIST